MAPGKEEMWLSLLNGTKATFTQFYDEFKALCFSLAVGITRDEDRAKDAVQESFVAIYNQVKEKRLQFESTRHARDYLLKTVKNIATDSATAQARRVELEEILDDLITDKDQEELYMEQEKLGALRKALKRLPSKYREVLNLRFYERMTLAEIAQNLGKPIPTIQYAEKRALEKLKKNEKLRNFFIKIGPLGVIIYEGV
ncbi:MAG: RNA polymerase sigma factor [bacterium]